MKLYGEANPAPNPRRVRIFAAEKGLDLPEIRIGMIAEASSSKPAPLDGMTIVTGNPS